jgi:hypothetical protein
MSNLEKAKQINERIELQADGRISVWCAGAWETSRLLAGLLSRIEDLERHLDKQDQSIDNKAMAQIEAPFKEWCDGFVDGGLLDD